MSTLYSLSVRWRRLVARRPWLYWCLVGACALAGGISVNGRVEELDIERRSWGDRRQVLMSVTATATGEPVIASVTEVPVSLVPDDALSPGRDRAPLIARHALAGNHILTELDVAGEGDTGPMALVPEGWLAVPIVEAPPSDAPIGEPIVVASDGTVVADGTVVGHHDDVTLVAVPAGRAASVAAAAQQAAITLLRAP